MVTAKSFTSFTRKLYLVHGRLKPILSASWKASFPIRLVETWPEKQTSGTESIEASTSAVTILLMPGPDVTHGTPGLPVAVADPPALRSALAAGPDTIQ